MAEYRKAVRDRIPEIIEGSGRICSARTLADGEFLAELERKLDEEVREYHDSKSAEELADILEVVFRIAELRGTGADSLEAIRRDKGERCGRFEKNLFLVHAENGKGD